MRVTKKKKFRAKVLIMISGLHKLRMMRIHSNLNIHILTLLPLNMTSYANDIMLSNIYFQHRLMEQRENNNYIFK